tara:strand:+ start:133386 stop:134576 length:1191 start_codon:yes stop_codon:yes gene_type:complete
MLVLGFASGFPYALTGPTLQAWYASTGIDIKTIGALSLIGLPYLLKPIWAPIMDRYVPPFLGRRRGWVLIAQVLLVLTIAWMALLNPIGNPEALPLVALFVAFLSASQDISLDAYRTDILDPEERGLGAAVWTAGWRCAPWFSGGIVLVIAEYVGWQWCYLLMAAVMSTAVITTILSPEPSNVLPPKTMTKAVIEPFMEFFSRPYAILLLLFIILYKFGDAFALSLSTTFYLRVVGLSLVEVGLITKSVAVIATFIGVFIGGFAMLRLKLWRSLLIFGILQALSNLMYLWLALAGKDYSLVSSAIFIEYLTGGMGTAVFVAYLMSLCDKRFTAFQFALFSVFSSLGRVLVGPFAAYVVEHSSWAMFFIDSVFLSIPGLLLLVWLRKRVNFDDVKIS